MVKSKFLLNIRPKLSVGLDPHSKPTFAWVCVFNQHANLFNLFFFFQHVNLFFFFSNTWTITSHVTFFFNPRNQPIPFFYFLTFLHFQPFFFLFNAWIVTSHMKTKPHLQVPQSHSQVPQYYSHLKIHFFQPLTHKIYFIFGRPKSWRFLLLMGWQEIKPDELRYFGKLGFVFGDGLLGGPHKWVLQSKQRQHLASLSPLHKFLRTFWSARRAAPTTRFVFLTH